MSKYSTMALDSVSDEQRMVSSGDKKINGFGAECYLKIYRRTPAMNAAQPRRDVMHTCLAAVCYAFESFQRDCSSKKEELCIPQLQVASL